MNLCWGDVMQVDAAKRQQQQQRLFFHELAGEIEYHLAARAPRVHLVGGRGTGKSFVLARLKLKTPYIVSFRETKLNNDLARKLKKHRGALCLDDVDVDYTPVMNTLLLDLLSEFHYPLVMTSTLRSDLALLREGGAFERLPWTKDVQAWSKTTSLFSKFEIDPWESGWRRRVVQLLKEVISSEDGDELAGYATIVVDLTGGHPLMLNEAFEELSQMPRTKRAQPRTSIEWKQEHAKLEERLFGDGLRKLRKFVTWLEELSPSAAEELRRLAHGESLSANVIPATRRALLDSGLVYRTPEKKMVLAGEVFRRFLIGNDLEQPQPIIVRATGQAGEIRATAANSTVSVQLRGAAWTLITTLRDSGRPMLIEDLVEKAGVQEGALRSAIQRIRNDFEERGITNVIENLWGEGYRLSAMPLLTLRALEQ